MMQLVDLAR
ncbi:hypothetical protein CF24_004336 [Escherichia coli]|nr:hypothetical protein [Escherichia coli]EIH9933614.1 hypothetical protein [Escherichia coli]